MRVVATRSETRTVVDTLRQEGLARCSRPFALPGGGARLVTLQLGPGFVRGDHFVCAGSVGARAELEIVPQAANRALGRGEASLSTARWTVAAGGTLRLLGEPLVLFAGARHHASLDVVLEAGATLVYADVIAAREGFEGVTTRLTVRSQDRLLVRDAVALGPQAMTAAVGTAYYLCAGAGAAQTQHALALADEAVERLRGADALRIGVGSPAAGGVVLRALGRRAAAVRTALLYVLAHIETGERGAGRA